MIGCASGSACAAEFITQRCKEYRHPEIRFEVSDDTPVEDAQWLIATLENMVSQGSRFRTGETIQFGWMVNRFEKAKGGTLRLLEPPMWSTAPADYQPSRTNTLYYLRRQKDTVESLEGGLPIVFPSMLQNALVHKDYNTLRTLTILREAPEGAQAAARSVAAQYCSTPHLVTRIEGDRAGGALDSGPGQTAHQAEKDHRKIPTVSPGMRRHLAGGADGRNFGALPPFEITSQW